MKYLAFISYKHGEVVSIAEKLARALRQYAKPLFRTSPAIFRDEDHFVPDLDLPRMIRGALEQSEFLILLASPEAAESRWVRDEIDVWCGELGRASRLIVVLCSGTIATTKEAFEVDWARTDALPASLATFLTRIPLYVDLTWARSETDVDLSNAHFKRVVNAIHARLHDVDPNQMLGEEVLQTRRNLRWRNLGFSALVLLVLATSAAAASAYVARLSAERNAQEARAYARTATANAALAKSNERKAQSRQLAAESTTARLQLKPDDLPLALQAAELSDTREAEDSLRAALLRPHPTAIFAGHDSWTMSASFAPDGATVASESSGDVHLWNAITGQPIWGLSGVVAKVLAFSRDGSYLIVHLPSEGKIQAWSTKDAKPQLSRSIDHEALLDAVLTDGELRFLTRIDERQLHLWNVSSERPIATIRGERMPIQLATLDQSGDFALTADPTGLVTLWAISSAPRRVHTWRPHQKPVTALAVSDGAGLVATSTDDGTVRLWTVESGTARVLQDMWHHDEVVDLDFSADGSKLASACGDGQARVWDLQTGRWTAFEGYHRTLTSVVLDDVGARIMLTGGPDGTASVWPVAADARPLYARALSPVAQGVIGAGGEELLTVHQDGAVRQWNVASGVELSSFESPDENALAVAYPANKVFVLTRMASIEGQGSLGIRHFPGGRRLSLGLDAQTVQFVRFSADGSRLATLAREGGATVWNSFSGKAVARFEQLNAYVAALSAAGTMLAAPGSAGVIEVQDLVTGEARLLEDAGTNGISALAFSRDGRLLAAGDANGMIRVWTVDSPERPLSTATGHSGPILWLEFNPGGDRIVTASVDGTVRLWDPLHGVEISLLQDNVPTGTRYKGAARIGRMLENELTPQPSWVSFATFTGEGRYVLAASYDGRIQSQPVHSSDLVATAKEQLAVLNSAPTTLMLRNLPTPSDLGIAAAP